MKLAWFISITALVLAAGCFRDHPTDPAIAATDCVSCHKDTFQTAPSHLGQGSTACASCHTPDTMPPWAFAHPQSPFPTETGKHAQFKDQCHTCHNASLGNDYNANLDCYGGGACHADSHHHDTTQPGRCFQCHPDGRTGGG